MLKRIVLLNGPAGSGKDTLAEQLEQRLNFKHLKITAQFKERVHGLYFMPHLSYDAFEHCKDQKRSEFFGLTPRQAYINVWEHYFKPIHGENFLIEELITQIDNSEHERFVISDMGFDREAVAFMGYYGVQAGVIKLTRSGHFFNSNDTRKYVSRQAATVKLPNSTRTQYSILHNSSTIDDLYVNFIDTYQLLFDDAVSQPLTEQYTKRRLE